MTTRNTEATERARALIAAHHGSCRSLADALAAREGDAQQLREALDKLVEGWALQLVERVEANHNELQRLGLIERGSGEASRKILGSMATDAVYLAALIRDARVLARVPSGPNEEPRP